MHKDEYVVTNTATTSLQEDLSRLDTLNRTTENNFRTKALGSTGQCSQWTGRFFPSTLEFTGGRQTPAREIEELCLSGGKAPTEHGGTSPTRTTVCPKRSLRTSRGWRARCSVIAWATVQFEMAMVMRAIRCCIDRPTRSSDPSRSWQCWWMLITHLMRRHANARRATTCAWSMA